MNILVYTTLFPSEVWPHRGNFVKERMARVARLPGNTLEVVAPVPYYPPIKFGERLAYARVPSHEHIDGIPVFHPRYLMTPKVGMCLYGIEMFLATLPLCYRLHKRKKLQVIDGHFVYPDGFAAWLLSRALKIPFVVTARGSDINVNKEFPLIRPLVRTTLQGAGRVIAVSRALKEAIVGLGVTEEKVTVIPNGIDKKRFAPLIKEDARAQLNLPDRQLILSIGNLTANKGFDVVIKALNILVHRDKKDSLSLVIAGDGPARSQLAALVEFYRLKGHVYFAGRIPHSQLPLWYGAADVFCLASEREGMPNVILESLACGVPVVGTPAGGIPEIVNSESVGLISDRTEEAMAEAISKVLERSWDRHELASHVNQWTWDDVADSVQTVFKHVSGIGSSSASSGAVAGTSTLS